MIENIFLSHYLCDDYSNKHDAITEGPDIEMGFYAYKCFLKCFLSTFFIKILKKKKKKKIPWWDL